jgi:hypothetical protein
MSDLTNADLIAAAYDPDAFDATVKKSTHPMAQIQWAARRKMAHDAAERLIASGILSSTETTEATPAKDWTVSNGYWLVPCDECDGTGVYEIAPGHTQPCNACKTQGLRPISMMDDLPDTTEAVKLDPEPIAIGYDEEGEFARVPYHAPMHPFHRFLPRAEYSQRAEDYAAKLTEKGEN